MRVKRKEELDENRVGFYVSLSWGNKYVPSKTLIADYIVGLLFCIVLVCQTQVEISVLCFKYFYNRTCINSEAVVIVVNNFCCFSLMFKALGFQVR